VINISDVPQLPEITIPWNLVVILFEVVLWVYLFLRFSRDLGYYKAMMFADFIITTIDLVLLFTSLRTTIFNIYLYNRRLNRAVAVIPITLGVLLIIKSIVFYLSHELFPEWFKRAPSKLMGGGYEYEQEEG